MNRIICLWFFLFAAGTIRAQVVNDDFSDGDFTNSPSWQGNTDAFIVNAENQLQLNFTGTTPEPSYLATNFVSTNLNDKEWRFDVQLAFSPSGSNRLVMYLASSTSDLLDYQNTASVQQAYYLEIGETGSDDAVSLFYRDGETSTLITRGTDGQFADAFEKTIRVRRDASANWEIAVSDVGTENFIVTATAQDNSLSETTNLGMLCFFTATRSDLFYFDNIYFGDFIVDTTPPTITEASVLNSQQIRLIFSESLNASSAEDINNYTLQAGDIIPESAILKEDTVLITFNNEFQNGQSYILQINGITDDIGNVMEPFSFEFEYIDPEPAAFGDIIITELLPDPTPSVGLPEAEFIEILNRSDKFIDLSGFTISDNTDNEALIPTYILRPNNRIILCPSGALEAYQEISEAISPATWPSLNNSSDSVVIKSAEGLTLDSLGYDLSWYQDEEKESGGYSLEIINTQLSCFDKANWAASVSDLGGTPGRINSINDESFTGNSPEIDFVEVSSPIAVIINFDKLMNRTSLLGANYLLNGEPVNLVAIMSPANNQVILTFDDEFVNGQSYTISVEEVADCNGNVATNLSYTFIYDELAPEIVDVFVLADSLLLVSFDEVILESTAEDTSNYILLPSNTVKRASLYDSVTVLLTLQNDITAGNNYLLRADSIQDMFGNVAVNEVFEFEYNNAPDFGYNDLMITEVMAKPIPDQLLPNREYLEIYNPTDLKKSLVGLQLSDSRDTTIFPVSFIEPNEYLIICPTSAVNELSEFGRAIGLSPWPSLNNAGDSLKLLNHDNALVFELNYEEDWYNEAFKAEEGGWSLEMIDITNPCGGASNWTASQANTKGTPGVENSVSEPKPDSFGPSIEKAFAISVNSIEVTFNESLDIERLNISNFQITPAIQVDSIYRISTNELRLFTEEMAFRTAYQLSISNVFDCAGNVVADDGSRIAFALPEEAVAGDVILNEVLYNPASGGVDFIELINLSPKYINLRGWHIKGSSQEETIYVEEDEIIKPGQYFVLTEDKEVLINQYATSAVAENIYETDLPSFPNDEGLVLVQSADSTFEEAFNYSSDFHLSFLRSEDGVSLERISPEAPIDSPESWKSAASSIGYATPGAPNSQLNKSGINQGTLTVNPPSFSPNRLGRSYTLINYELSNAGNLATVKIFNSRGQLIKTLANNETLSSTGFFRWDGDDNTGRKVGIGYYFIYFELFNSNGNTEILKERVAVGGNF